MALQLSPTSQRQSSSPCAAHRTRLSSTRHIVRYCNAPLTRSDEQKSPEAFGATEFITRDYFRLLDYTHAASQQSSRSATPSHQLGAASVSGSEPAPSPALSNPTSDRISSSAFSQGYLNKFFRKERELGRGGAGVVWLVKHVVDNEDLGHFACKRVPVGDNKAWLRRTLDEVRLLQELSINHENLVTYHHAWLEEDRPSGFGPSVPCLFILQQYCNAGTLHDYVLGEAHRPLSDALQQERLRRRSKGQMSMPGLSKSRDLQFDEIFSFFLDITSGLDHLHSRGYIHRDLKPGNCLLHLHGNRIPRVLISDFGEVQGAGAPRTSSGATGTLSFCAPEVLVNAASGQGLGNFTKKSDIFSLGLTVYFMCFKGVPYSNSDDVINETEDVEVLREEISKWPGMNEERLRADLPDQLYMFLRLLLSTDAEKRPSTAEILHTIRSGGVPATEGTARRSPSTDKEPFRRPSNAEERKHSLVARQSAMSISRGDQSASQAASGVKRIDRPLLLPPGSSTPVLTRLVSTPKDVLGVALFCLKVWSLSMLCRPLAVRVAVQMPLTLLAAVDLRQHRTSISAVLLIIHVCTIVVLHRLESLCEI
ncbi:hypothetical protein MRB53_042171 [Persea americana]|nr:hypothetical protein MRB53_042171 [Persea americana]